MMVLWWALFGFFAGWLADRLARFFASHMEAEPNPVKIHDARVLRREWGVAALGLMGIWGVAPLFFREASLAQHLFFFSWTWVGWVACLLDWRYRLLPIEALFVALWGAVLFQLAMGASPWLLVLGLLVGGGIPLLLVVLSKGKMMGWADPLAGAFFGVALLWPSAAFFMEGAFLLGGVLSLGLWLKKRHLQRLTLPFVPCLFFSAYITFLGSHVASFSRVFLAQI